MSTHTNSSTTTTHAEGDPWVEGRTTVVINGWNFATITSTAHSNIEVSCFRVLDRDLPGWNTERHPTLDGRLIPLDGTSYDEARAVIAREAYELGVLGQFQYHGFGRNPHYTEQVA